MKWFKRNQFLLGIGIGLAMVLAYLPILSHFWRAIIFINLLGIAYIYQETQIYGKRRKIL